MPSWFLPYQAPECEGFLTVMGTIRFQESEETDKLECIGTVSMCYDGTIHLELHAKHGWSTMGDALLTYPKNQPYYKMILGHLDGSRPGEHKPVEILPAKK